MLKTDKNATSFKKNYEISSLYYLQRLLIANININYTE